MSDSMNKEEILPVHTCRLRLSGATSVLHKRQASAPVRAYTCCSGNEWRSHAQLALHRVDFWSRGAVYLRQEDGNGSMVYMGAAETNGLNQANCMPDTESIERQWAYLPQKNIPEVMGPSALVAGSCDSAATSSRIMTSPLDPNRVKCCVLNVPASPLRGGPLQPDEPRVHEPVYDQLEDLPQDGLDSVDEDQEGGAWVLRESGHPLSQWVVDHRDMFLHEILRWEGRGDHRSYPVCPECQERKVEYRCKDCTSGGQLVCKECVLNRHAQLPFHHLEVWMGSTFLRQTLKDLGLRIQLGHWHGQERRCPAPEPSTGDDFVVINNHGVHQVNLDYCGCGSGGTPTVQLLRAGLYPSTTINPWIAAAVNVLRWFHFQSFESKCSVYEFYQSLARETCNTGLETVKNHYHEFLRMTREWWHLQMIKRAGWGHVPDGIAMPGPGDCALLYPACPHPGHTGGETGLGPGWAFFCEVKAYMEHITKQWDEPEERSHCVAHDAVDKPDQEARGTASSRTGAVDCAHHNVRPQATYSWENANIFFRYINMDYMFFRSVTGSELLHYFVSYDITCQWHINIWNRMSKYREDIQMIGGQWYITFLVPKFHLPAHIESCNLHFSFNLTRDVGQTDGEAPERGTKEMGPGSRHDTLDDHFNDWNHKKIIAFGQMFQKKTEHVVPEMVETREALRDMEESLAGTADGEKTVKQWTVMAERWENPDAPNPFETVKKDEHLVKVQCELAEEAAAREAAGIEDVGAVCADMHVTELITMGLQLQEQQRSLGLDMAAIGLHPTDKQRTAMVEQIAKLRQKIVAWINIQILFFPQVTRLRELEDDTQVCLARMQPMPGIKAHEIVLWLPSAICDQPGAESDGMYRVAQAALAALGRVLKTKEWEMSLKPLHEDDVQGLPRAMFADPDRQRGKKGRLKWKLKKARVELQVSWIWIAQAKDQKAGDPPVMNEALRIQWAKACVRSLCWSEEVDLLEEEMRCVQEFLMWQSHWWKEQVDRRGLPDGVQREGETVYTLRQAAFQADLCAKFAEDWAHLLELIRQG
ncbi:hypothetical protein B0H10DRAFT_1951632 [Mycena sp. CBHHK59/15]|nr:hypothetical protein B0H10DRAFT_1951632 [Mycena sp. CBHHK59/15]